MLDGAGTGTEAGLVYTMTVLPYVVFGVAAGVVGDRHGRRRILWRSHAVQIAAALVIPGWALFSHPPIAVVVVAALSIGTARVFADAAVFGAVAAIIGRERFVRGQATLSAAWALGLLAGPAVGGVLIAAVGPALALVVEAFGFAVATLAVLAIRTPLDALAPRSGGSARAMVVEGFDVIRRDRRVRSYTWLSVAWNAAAAVSAVLAVPLLRDELSLSSTQTGAILAVSAATALLIPLFLGRVTDRAGGGRVAAFSTAVSGTSILALGLAPGFGVAMAASAARYLMDFTLLSTIIGERQRGVPDALQARVGMSGRVIAYGAYTAGAIAGSLLAAPIGLRGSYVVSAVLVFVALAAVVPRVLRDDRRA